MDIIYSLWAFLTAPWAILALVASLAFASENYFEEWLLKRLGNKNKDAENTDHVGTLVTISGLFGLVITSISALIAYSMSSSTIFVDTDTRYQAVLVGALEIVWIIPYLYAIKRAGALKAAPLFQSVPVIALVLGLYAFAEVPPVVHIIGACIIVGGGLLLNLGEFEGKWGIDKKTVALMLGASAIIALISFLFKDATIEGNFVATVFWGGIGMVLASVVMLIVWRPYRYQFWSFCRAVDKKGLLLQMLNETLDMFAVLTQHAAMVLGPTVMTVSAFNAYQPVFILLIGWILAKCGSEDHNTQLQKGEFAKKTFAIALIALGTVFIAQ